MLAKEFLFLFKKKSKSGQALIELLPAILIFMLLITSIVVFFQGLRESSRAQEAARNAAFSKIANSGPLVSEGGGVTVPGEYSFGIGGNSGAINNNNTCFKAMPQANKRIVNLPKIMGVEMGLSRVQEATVFRRPASKDFCN